MKIRTYSELVEFDTLEARFEYLMLKGQVGEPTFGSERWMNQGFYHSAEWRDVRHTVILRDEGCDLGLYGHDIFDKILIHHMNPMSVDDLRRGSDEIIDPEYLISVRHRTHNAIHYGDRSQLPQPWVPRTPGDTKLW